jgi:hypothetical protein
MHTTGIVFIGTPHRFKSHHDALDQLYKLVFLPGPDIKRGVSRKVEHLTEQISLTNKQFVTTKLLDRACIFNIISQSIVDTMKDIADANKLEGADGRNYGKDRTWSNATVTPFHRYSHFIGHSFESSGRVRQHDINHLDLTRDEGCSALETFSERFEMAGFSKWAAFLRLKITEITNHLLIYRSQNQLRPDFTPVAIVIPCASNAGA